MLHDSLNFAGGAERVCLQTIDSIQELGHQVTLGTIDETDWEKVDLRLGGGIRPRREVHLWRVNSAVLRVYTSVLLPLVLSKLKSDCDLIVCTNLDVFPLSVDLGYMHYVPLCSIPRSNTEKNYSTKWYFYSFLGQKLQSRLLHTMRVRKLITNSSFSRRLIMERTGFDAEVVYPAVDIEKFKGPRHGNRRKNQVVSIGRLSPEKNFEFVLELAERIPYANFVIIASLAGINSRAYLERLHGIARMKKLTNLTILVNLSLERVLEVLHSSRVFLHAAKEEHFGLVVVEAMAAGLIPVVHRSGGQWEDLLETSDGLHGYSYQTPQEAQERIEMILGTGTADEIQKRDGDWVEKFSLPQFREKMQAAINQLIRD